MISLISYLIINPYFSNYEVLYVLITGSFIFFIIGLLDDLFNLSPFLRLIIEFATSAFIWAGGIKIQYLDISFIIGGYNNLTLPTFLSLLITCFWIVGIINAFNWIDGLDGLSSSLSIICSSGFLIISILLSNQFSVYICSSIIGSCLGFLYLNKYPAKIIMGDCGSHFLGFIMATISIISSRNIILENNSLIALIPLLILSFPLTDMFFVILKRLINNKSPFFPDRSHFHYKLIDAGFSYQETLNLLFLCSIFGSTLAIIYLIIFQSKYYL